MVIRSRYRIFPVLFLFFLIVLLGKICHIIFIKLLRDGETFQELGVGPILFILLLYTVEIILVYMFMTDCRRVRVDKEKIVFINPIFPFIRKKVKWRDIDYYITVGEHSKYDTYDTIWLIRRGRLKGRIPSFYLANYWEIKDGLCVRNQGDISMNSFKQLVCRLRLMKISSFHSRYSRYK